MGLPTQDPMDRGNTVYQPLYLICFNLNFPCWNNSPTFELLFVYFSNTWFERLKYSGVLCVMDSDGIEMG